MEFRTCVCARTLLFCFCLVMFLQRAMALQCYQCDSFTNPDCGIPFHGRPALLATCLAGNHSLYCVYIHNHNTTRVQRGCDSTLKLMLAWQMSETRVDPQVQEMEVKIGSMECVTAIVTPSFECVTQCRCTKPGCNCSPSPSPAPWGLIVAVAVATYAAARS